jgi:NAD(P)-dependent dehydrogenase (short-subunit alcohol dehydrogenase family)
MMRTAVVTGGASGIGLATVDALLAAGWQVHVVDRSPCPRERAVSHVADITDEAALVRVADAITQPVSAVICAAGVWDVEGDGGPTRVDLGVWERTLAVNLTGTLLTVRVFADRMADNGAIVTVASVAALAAVPKRDAYTASKGAVVALTRSWAVEFSRRGIRVNCVCPGPTRTAMTAEVFDSVPDEKWMSLPQQRTAHADEIAAAIAFLASPQASYISGTILPVDAGATAALAGLPFPTRLFDDADLAI